MMQKSVAHGRFVNVARFRVGDVESVVAAMCVRFVFQVAVEREDVVHEPMLELLHVALIALTAQKFLPCGEQVFHRNDIFIGMSGNTPQVVPPPAGICSRFWSESNKLICCGERFIIISLKNRDIRSVEKLMRRS